MQHFSDPKSTGSRPSLFSASDTGSGGGERILDRGFDGGKMSSPATLVPRRAFKSLLLLTILGISALGIWFVQQDKMSSALKRNIGATSPLSSPAITDAGTPSITTTPPASFTPVTPLLSKSKAQTDPESNTAVLVSEGAAINNHGSNPQARRQDHLAKVLEADVAPNPKALKTALEAKPTKVKSGPKVKSRSVVIAKNLQKSSSRPAKTANASKTPTLKKTIIVSAPRAGTKATTLAGKKQPTVVLKKPLATPVPSDTITRQMDGDVDLISALVSHSIESEQKQASRSVRNVVPAKK